MTWCMLSGDKLIWDEWNVSHVAQHEVTPGEVEQVCHGDPAEGETYSGRVMLIGPTTAGRMLTVILAPKEQDSYYVVTARPASRRERATWAQKEAGENQ